MVSFSNNRKIRKIVCMESASKYPIPVDFLYIQLNTHIANCNCDVSCLVPWVNGATNTNSVLVFEEKYIVYSKRGLGEFKQ